MQGKNNTNAPQTSRAIPSPTPTPSRKPKKDPDFAGLSEFDFSEAWRGSFPGEFLWARDRGCWMAWQPGPGGGLWRPDDISARSTMVAAITDVLQQYRLSYPEASHFGARKVHMKSSVVRGSLEMAKRPDVAVSTSMFNRSAELVGLADGSVLNLRSGRARAGKPEDLVSLSLAIGVKPAAGIRTSPRWESFLLECLSAYDATERIEVATYLQTWMGYCLTAITKAEQFCFLVGPPRSGKSTFVEVMSSIFGDYAKRVAADRLTADARDHRQWLARLESARLICIPDIKDGRWKTADLQGLVSGEVLEVNYMNQNSIEIKPVGKLLLAGNRKPRGDAASGLWRRMSMIKFENKPVNPDSGLKAALLVESEGILAWSLFGARRYLKHGIAPPACILRDTESYRLQEDAASDFVDDCLTLKAGSFETVSGVYKRYQAWAVDAGTRSPWSKRFLSGELGRMGVSVRRGTGGQHFYHGLELSKSE